MKCWVLFAVALLLLPGCLGNDYPTQAFERENGFIMPESGLAYKAEYVVDENGQQSTKTVWRSKDKMRIRHDFGESALDLYFLKDRAYSCFSGSKVECFDITPLANETMKKALIEIPRLADSTPVEDVNIGKTDGKCYTAVLPSSITRKFCLTNNGILAYDEYPLGKVKHIEYATGISYLIDETAFRLPATPKEMPVYS